MRDSTKLIIGVFSLMGSLIGMGIYVPTREYRKDKSYNTMAKLADTNKDRTTTHEEWGAAFSVLRELGEDVHYDVHVSPRDYLSSEQIRKYNFYMEQRENQNSEKIEQRTETSPLIWPRLKLTSNPSKTKLG